MAQGDDRIILDSSSFKALASETRVHILKELGKKRSTASELAKILGMSVQAASEHLENLRVAGLVERVDEGRKWVYFQLTEKGKAVVQPEGGKRFWIMLSLFALLLAGSAFMLSQNSLNSGSLALPSFRGFANPSGDALGVGSGVGVANINQNINNPNSGSSGASTASGGQSQEQASGTQNKAMAAVSSNSSNTTVSPSPSP